MNKAQKLIFYSIVFAGALLPSLVNLFTDEHYRWPLWVSLTLLIIATVYASVRVWQNKDFRSFKRMRISLLVVGGTLLLLYLIWGIN